LNVSFTAVITGHSALNYPAMNTSLASMHGVDQDRMERSFRVCVQDARKAARNFHYAFLSLPKPKYKAMCALYCFMRQTDDLADDGGMSVETRRLKLTDWSRQIDDLAERCIVDGNEIFPALKWTLDTYQIPVSYLHDVIAGVTMDLDPQPFSDFTQLERYCYHVAGAVGLCCISIWGYDESDVARRAAIDCGTAFQLTNILRDIREDATLGRCYLPQDQLRAYQLSSEQLATGTTPGILPFLTEQTQLARSYYQRASKLSGHLSKDGQGIFRGMMRIYGGLLHKIECNPLSVMNGRVKLHRIAKMRIAMESFLFPNRPLPKWMTAE
jgi:phytoene synthase